MAACQRLLFAFLLAASGLGLDLPAGAQLGPAAARRSMRIRALSLYSLTISGATADHPTGTISLNRFGAIADRFVQIIRMIRTTRLIGDRNRRRTNQSSRRRRARWKHRRQRLYWSSAIRWASGWRMDLSWYSRKRRKLASFAGSSRI